MAKRYESGTRQEVLAYMAECAIRDRESMLECYEPYIEGARLGFLEKEEDTEMYIEEIKAEIRDFKRFLPEND